MTDRCTGVFRLPLPLNVNCTVSADHDEHRAGWLQWTDEHDLSYRIGEGGQLTRPNQPFEGGES